MNILLAFLPLLFFASIFVGSGVLFTLLGRENAFYIISPVVAMMPALALAWKLKTGDMQEKMDAMIDGMRHRDIITMCVIFLLAGALGNITAKIGAVDATVNFAINLVPHQFIIIGLFLVSAFISTAIGTSLGTIATIAPIALGLASEGAGSIALCLGTVVGGSMFGDNLAISSDTTIASVTSQGADPREKFKLNAKIALLASIATIVILLLSAETNISLIQREYSLILIAPYILLIALTLAGMSIFTSLFASILFAYLVGYLHHGYSFFSFNTDLVQGFFSMQEIMILSIMVGGLFGLANQDTQHLAEYLVSKIKKKKNSARVGQFLIAKIAFFLDLLLANNTIAIIYSGEIAKNIARKCRLKPHYSAVLLDIFSCVGQGLIPYGAQILLASKIGGVSPLEIVPNVYYCYTLAISAIFWMYLHGRKHLLSDTEVAIQENL